MSSTLQFVVAGALIVAWVWMLGRPILTNLFRRSRRDSVGYFRYQQAVLSQQGGPRRRSSLLWEDRPRPLLYWRSQQLEQRRLQTMLGFAIATFISMLLAIALRGVFVRLFLVVGICFVLYLCVAAYIGAAQLRRQLEVRSTQGMYTAKRADPQAQVHGTVEQAPGLRAGFDRLEPEASEVLTDRPGSVLWVVDLVPGPVVSWQQAANGSGGSALGAASGGPVLVWSPSNPQRQTCQRPTGL